MSELSGNVSQAVANNADQVPESGVLQGAGDELGEFIFIKLKVDVQGVDPSKVKVGVEISPESSVITEKNISIEKTVSEPQSDDPNPILSLPVPTL